MTTYIGGLRDRLVSENVRLYISSAMEDLNWLDTPNGLVQNSITILTGPLGNDVELLPNIISICAEEVRNEQAELGSNYSNYTWSYAIDIYAEDDASGRHLVGDLRAILQGKFSSIGQNGPSIDIYDLTQATPTVIFTVQVDEESIVSAKQKRWNQSYEKFWYTIVFDLIDTYGNEDDA
jgi:hypothetical protein